MGEFKCYLLWSFSLLIPIDVFSQEVIGSYSDIPKLISPLGFEYQIVRRGSSTKPIPINGYVFFNMTLTEKDSVLQTTAYSGKPSVLKITEDLKGYGKLSALVDLMGNSHKGDSISFYFPVEFLEKIPPGYEKFTEPLVYHVGIVNVMNEIEFEDYSISMQREQNSINKLTSGRLPEIEAMTKAIWEAYKKRELDDQMITTVSGLKYIVHDPGYSENRPTKGGQVYVHYYGMLAENGKMFDSSFKSGQPYQFALDLGQVIKGWDIGISLLNKGAKATLFIPPDLGYGVKGSPPIIPPNAELIFYVELVK
ncbi:MAG: FKBP-type peptidyl-prolyl cis-trans isomerase [Saprospiraceae bacterium]